VTLAEAVARLVAKYEAAAAARGGCAVAAGAPLSSPSASSSVTSTVTATAAATATATATATAAAAAAAAAADAAAAAASHRPPPGADSVELKAGRKARRYASMLLAKLLDDPTTSPSAAGAFRDLARRLDAHEFARPPPVGAPGWARQAWPFDVDAFVDAVHGSFVGLYGYVAVPGASPDVTATLAGVPTPVSAVPPAERRALRRLADDFDQAMGHVPFVPSRIPRCRLVTGAARRAVMARLALSAAEDRLAARSAAAASAPRPDEAAQRALCDAVAALPPTRMRGLIALVARLTGRADLASSADVTVDVPSLDDRTLGAIGDFLGGRRCVADEERRVAALRSAVARKEAAAAREEVELAQPITTKVKVQRRFQAQVHVPGWAAVVPGGGKGP